MPKIISKSPPPHRVTEPTTHRPTNSPVYRTGLPLIIATIPLPYASVQPVVWTAYAALIFLLFIYGLWRDQLDFRFMKSPLLVFSIGLFLVYTLLQSVPIPVDFLQFLNPFQYRVVQESAALLDEKTPWHAISYVSSASFAWWIWLFSLVLFFGLARVHLANSRNLVAMVYVMMTLALAEALYGLLQVLVPTLGVLWVDIPSGFGNARGTFINRNHFAGFIEMVWPIGLGLMLAKTQAWKKDEIFHGTSSGKRRLKLFLSSDRLGFQLAMVSAFLFILLALLFSKSRAGITGAFIGFSVFLLLCRIGGKKLSVLAWVTMGMGFSVLFLYGGVIGFEQIIERFMALEGGAGSRVNRWKDTLSIVMNHPLGIGLANYEHVMPVFNTLGPYDVKSAHAHNDYLQLLAEAGWPGFVAMVGGFYFFLGECVWRIRKYGPQMEPLRFYTRAGAVSGLVSIAFHSFFDFNLQIPANMLYFVVLLAIAASGERSLAGKA